MAIAPKYYKILIAMLSFVSVLVAGVLVFSSTLTLTFALNQTNVTEQINVTCTTAINVPDAGIDVGTGFITQNCIDCWIGSNTSSCSNTAPFNVTNGTAVINTKFFQDSCWINTTSLNLPDAIHIKNKGNNFINLSITLLNDDGWSNQTGGSEFGNNSIEVFLQQGNATNATLLGSDDQNISCLRQFMGAENETTLQIGVLKTLCGAMAWEESRNELFLFDKFIINPKTDPRQYTLTKRLTATEFQCGGSVSVGSNPTMAIADASAGPNAIRFLDKDEWADVFGFAFAGNPASISVPYSIAAMPNFAAGGGNSFINLGRSFGTGDVGTPGCTVVGNTHCARIFDLVSPVPTQTVSAFQNFPLGATTDLNADDSLANFGGPGLAATQRGNNMYVLIGKNGIANEGTLFRGQRVGTDYNFAQGGGYGNISNVCDTFAFNCTSNTTSSCGITNAYKAVNGQLSGSTGTDLLWVAFCDRLGSEKLGLMSVDSAGTKTAIQNPVSFPTVSTDIWRDVDYDPGNGELFTWADAQQAGIYNISSMDHLDVFLLLRTGNDGITGAPIVVGQFWPANPFIGGAPFNNQQGIGIIPIRSHAQIDVNS